MNTNKEKLKNILESDEAFLSFLIQGSRSEAYRRVKHRAETGDHPSAEMIGGYVSDQLDEEETENIMRHLATCKICNDEVLMLRTVENESAEETEEDIARIVSRPPDWTEKIKKLVSDTVSAYRDFVSRAWFKPLISGLGMAAACVMLYLIISPDTGELLADAYRTAIRQNLTEGQSFGFPRKEDQAYGLTPSSQDKPRCRAFAAGLHAGSQKMKQSPDSVWSPEQTAEKWTETRWAAYFHAGQWSFLLRTVSLSDTDIPTSFWKKQKDILVRLRKDFEAVPGRHEEEIRIVTARFDSLQTLLERPEDISPGKRQKIARETELLINYLSSE